MKEGRRKRGAGAGGGLSPPPIISICIRQSKTLRPEKCEPNSDLLKKMKKPRLALSTLLAHMLQAIFDSLFSSIPINSFPNFQFVIRFSVKYHFSGRWKSYSGGSRF